MTLKPKWHVAEAGPSPSPALSTSPLPLPLPPVAGALLKPEDKGEGR